RFWQGWWQAFPGDGVGGRLLGDDLLFFLLHSIRLLLRREGGRRDRFGNWRGRGGRAQNWRLLVASSILDRQIRRRSYHRDRTSCARLPVFPRDVPRTRSRFFPWG